MFIRHVQQHAIILATYWCKFLAFQNNGPSNSLDKIQIEVLLLIAVLRTKSEFPLIGSESWRRTEALKVHICDKIL